MVALHLTAPRRGATTTRKPAGNPDRSTTCPTTPSAICSGSRPLARATGRRSARGRRLPARHPADRERHPAVSRQAPARAIALHHPAAGARRRAHPLRRVRRRAHRRAGDHRHADRAPDRQCRPALQGLFGHSRQIPARPRRLHLRCEVWIARLSRRRAAVGARDRDAGCGRRHCAQGRAGHDGARRAHSDGAGKDRPRALGLGRGGAQSVLLSGRAKGEILRKLSRRHPQERLVGRRGDRGGGRRRAGGAWRAGLRQARRRFRRGDDDHQCGQRRRDRRRHGRGRAHRRGERRRDAHGQ